MINIRPRNRSLSKNRRGFIISPITKRRVKIGSKAYENLGETLRKTRGNSLEKQKEVYDKVKNHENKRYKGLKKSDFCGPAGGDQPQTFPVSNQEECRAALTYARYAPKPEGIRKCALAKAKKNGWKCGVTLNENANKNNRSKSKSKSKNKSKNKPNKNNLNANKNTLNAAKNNGNTLNTNKNTLNAAKNNGNTLNTNKNTLNAAKNNGNTLNANKNTLNTVNNNTKRIINGLTKNTNKLNANENK